MNLTFKDTSKRTVYRGKNTTSSAPLSPKLLPLSSGFYSAPQQDLYNKKRPSKQNSSNLSFEGLFFSPVMDSGNKAVKVFNAEEVLAITDKYLGKSSRRLFESLTKLDESKKLTASQKLAKKMISVDEKGQITFQKKTFAHLLYDGLVYPIKVLPTDILNGAVAMLKKIKPLSKWADSVYESPMFKNIRQRSKIDSKINAARGQFETISKLNSRFLKGEITEDQLSSELVQSSVKMFNSSTGSYDTKHERSLNRIVSGAIPAVFLANDAYNLSRMCDDDKKLADKEQKVRFKQELKRVGLQAYITLVTLGAMQKFINNSKFGIMLTTGLTVLSTEIYSRLSNGKHITRLTPKQAQELNAKEQGITAIAENAVAQPNVSSKPISFSSEKAKKVFAPFTSSNKIALSENSTTPAADIAPAAKGQAPLLGLNSILKASAISIGAGLTIKGLRSIKVLDKAAGQVFDEKAGKMVDKYKKPVAEFIDNLLKPVGNLYKKLTVEKNHKIPQKQFEDIVKVLNDSGFPEIANKYTKIADINKSALIKKELSVLLKNEASDLVDNKEVVTELKKRGLTELANKAELINKEYSEYLHLGSKNKKIKPLIDFVKAPFVFMYDTVTLPYRLVDKAIQMFSTQAPKPVKTLAELDVEALAKSIENIGKEALKKNFDAQSFKDYVDLNIQKAFNVDNVSNVSNSELANLAKTAATAGTIWFLMADNYNMVMMKSNGKDKEGAELKSKERLIQESSRFFYQTLLIDLFNTTFKTQYNKSLLGMSVVTASCTGIGEYLTRKSVGVPIGKHSRDEILQAEKEKEASTGFVKGYYNFMSRLTGKKSLAEQSKAKLSAKA